MQFNHSQKDNEDIQVDHQVNTFDLDHIPPNFEWAILQQNASSVGKNIQGEEMKNDNKIQVVKKDLDNIYTSDHCDLNYITQSSLANK